MFLYLPLALAACNNYNLKDKLETPGLTESFSDRLVVFVSSAQTMGAMQELAADSCTGAGLSRADCYCQETAKKSGRRMNSASRFVAWLTSTDVVDNTMLCRILGLSGNSCAPTGNFVWYNTQKQPVFSGMSSLFTATPALINAIRFTEAGELVPLTGLFDEVWTGTAQDGTSNVANCNDWTDASMASIGLVGGADQISASWTNSITRNCDTYHRVFCFAVP